MSAEHPDYIAFTAPSDSYVDKVARGEYASVSEGVGTSLGLWDEGDERQAAKVSVAARESQLARAQRMDAISVPKMDFQGLFEASPNPYLVLDRKLHIVGANRAYLVSVKRELADIVGRWAWDAFPADAETVRQAISSFERVIRTKQPDTMALLRFDVPRPKAEGGGFVQRYWSITHVPVLDAAGDVSLVLQHPIDVTELQHLRSAPEQVGDAAALNLVPAHSGIFSRARSVHESNLALQTERDWLTEMFAQAPGFMAVLQGREHRIELANPSYMRLIGHRTVVGRTVAEALPDAVEQGFLDLLDGVFDSGEAYAANGAAYDVQAAPDGPVAKRYVDFVLQPIKDDGGRVTGIFVEGSDVTDRTLGEANLRASEARNRQILDSAIDYAIIATDLEGRVTRWNEGARRVLGWTEEEMLGQPANRFFTPEDVAAGQIQKEMQEALETGHGADERWHQRKGGERFWASGEMMALRDESGVVVGFVKVLRDRTEQRLAEEADRLGRVRLAAAVDIARLGTFQWDVATGAVELSDRSREIFALPETGPVHEVEIFGRIASTDIGRILNKSRMAAASGSRLDEEYTIELPDGTSRIVHSLGDFLGSEVGGPSRMYGVFKDVTNQRRAEGALRASEERLRALVSASSESLYSMNPDWTEMRQLTGGGFLADTASVNRNWLTDYIPPDDYSDVRAAIREAVRTKSVFNLEHRVRRADGTLGWTLSRAVPLFDATGEITEWFGTASDVTARREAEESLRRLNETLEQQVSERTADRDRLWRISQDPFLITDEAGRWLRVSPAWTEILGWSKADLIGRTSEWMEHPEDRSKKRAEVDFAARQTTLRFENRFRAKDGTYHWFSWTAVPTEGLLYCVARDVTAEKALAADREMLEEQLRQSQKMEAVGQLTGGLAHDFNNLLTGVTGSLELLQTRIAQGRIKDVDRFVNAALGAAKRAAALTHRLLAFSRRQTLAPKPTDVNRLMAGMGELVRRTLGPEIMLEPVAGDGLWTVLVDPSQLENALLNLCINARDAMPDGGKLVIETGNRWLDVRAAKERDLPPGQYVSLCVSDNGTGMSAEVIAKAFDPFFTTKPIGMGTGLGLSMIYGFARQSGGQVRIYSEVGQGTTVCLYLPRHLGAAEAAEVSAELSDAARAEHDETVLVVDDEPTVRMLVTEVLEDLGYTAIEAADGAAGLKVLNSEARVDLLVTDVGLPGGMNGRQVADAARVARPKLKVLFITGYAENAVLSHGHLESGMHVLTKPFAMETLASRIKDLITEG